MTACYLRGIRYHVPETRLTNDDLSRRHPAWKADRIYDATGIRERRLASLHTTAGDLAALAAEQLLADLRLDRSLIDAILLCTQSPDYFPVCPSTACLLQTRLGLSTGCAAFDFNLGCSGYTYGLWLARSLIISGSARNVLLLTAETITRYCDPQDMATLVNFGDGAAATWLSGDSDQALAEVGMTVYGTDGRGAENLMIPGGGARDPAGRQYVTMNGAEVFCFTLFTVKQGIQHLLDRTALHWDDVDWFFLHQASGFLLDKLVRDLGVPPEKCPIDLEEFGNTSSASIPLLLRRCQERNLIHPGQQAVLAGFGVGYSWAITHLRFLHRAESELA